MMKVFVKQPGAEAPGDEPGITYVVARQGLLMRLNNDWVDAMIRVKQFGGLEEEKERANLRVPPISKEVFGQCMAFFSKVYNTWGTEAAVLLHYAKDKGWAYTVPKQRISRAYVKYEMDERLEGYRCIGTMHSHGDFPAAHSPTDVKDEAEFDGIHITVGSFDRYPLFTLSAEVVIRGERFPLEESCIEGVVSLSKKNGDANPYRTHWARIYERFQFDTSVVENWKVPDEWADRFTDIQQSGRFFPSYFRPRVASQPVVAAEAESQEVLTSVPVIEQTAIPLCVLPDSKEADAADAAPQEKEGGINEA